MKNLIFNILNQYLLTFPEETIRLRYFSKYLENSKDKEICDWDNRNGHVTAGTFIYAKTEQKFLVLYHKELKMYLYPGGHCTLQDNNPFETALRETYEETGLQLGNSISFFENECIPIDIDTHLISYDKSCDMPEHYHFDFRYLFIMDHIPNVVLDDESSSYKWICKEELKCDENFGNIIAKLELLLVENNH